MKQVLSALLVIAAVLLLVASASAAAVGVNFVDSNGVGADPDNGVQDGIQDSLAPADLAGAPGYEQLNWNNLGRWGTPDFVPPLHDHAGVSTGINVTWDSNNTWRDGADLGTPNGKLMYGYIDSTGNPNQDGPPYQGFNNANKPDIRFTGLSAWLSSVGASSYSVLIYTDGDATEGRTAEYWLQSILSPPDQDFNNLTLGPDLSSHIFNKDTDNFAGTFTQIPAAANSLANAASGNYMVFDGLTADQFLVRTEERDFRGQLNGIQIVAAVPEPSTLVLLALGGLILLKSRAGKKVAGK